MKKANRSRFLLLGLVCCLMWWAGKLSAQDFTHSGSISGTWTTGSTHYISGDANIPDDNTLTIESGVVVKFAPGAELYVMGTLDVNGTSGENNDVVFTSRDDDSRGGTFAGSDGAPAAGDWDGIYVSGNGTYEGLASFDYCTIRFGGYASGSPKANIYYYDDAAGNFTNSVCDSSGKYGIFIAYCDANTITLDNSTIQNSADHGVYSSPWSRQVITNNTFTNNSGKAAYLYVAYLVTVAGNDGTGNGLNALEMDALSLQSSCTWSTSSSFPIVLYGQSSNTEGDTLTIAAGSIVKGKATGELWISGALEVNGASYAEVIFTSFKDDAFGGNTDGVVATPAAGDWDGIYLYGSDAPQGIGHFDYARIRYGGASGGGVGANVFFYHSDTGSVRNSHFSYSGTYGGYMSYCSNGTISIDNTLFENSASYGLYSDGWSKHIITNTSFDYNGDYGAYLSGGILIQFISNSGEGNVKNGLRLEGTQSMDGYWSSTGSFPIVLASDVTVADDKTLTIAAGSVIKATSTGRLFVSGTVDVNGTSDSMVTFTSLKDDSFGGNTDGDGGSPAAGDWKGIILYGDGSYEGTGYFDYTRVRYGRGPEWGGVYANVEFYKSDAGSLANSISEYAGDAGISIGYCSPTITASTIRNNGTYGIYAGGGTLAAPIVTNNIIDNNGNYAVYLNGIAATAYAGNSGTGNATNEFGVYGDVTSSVSWSSGSDALPISLIYPVTVASGQTLTVSSGILRCNTYSITGEGGFTLSPGATLQIGSTSGLDANINLTGTENLSTAANYSFYAPGGGAQVSSAGFPATVNNLTIHNPDGVVLTNDLALTGILTLTSGDFNLNGRTTSFAAITGTNGTATITKSLNAPSGENVGGLGAVITSGQDLGSTLVRIGCSPFGAGGGSIKRWYTITPTNNSGLNATLVFPYTEGDQLNGIAEANLAMFRTTDGGATWSNVGGSLDIDANTVTLTGISTFSQWTLGDNATPLPVEVTTFAAEAAGSTVRLRWMTASETNSALFEVERRELNHRVIGSLNDWMRIGTVASNGTTDVPQSYSFEDRSAGTGRFAYRLKQIDKDGSFSFSQSVEVEVMAPTAMGLLQNYPNPFNPTTAISCQLSAISQTRLSVYDLLGREVAVLVNGMMEPGYYTVEWDGSGQPSGVYFIRLQAGSTAITKRAVLQK